MSTPAHGSGLLHSRLRAHQNLSNELSIPRHAAKKAIKLCLDVGQGSLDAWGYYLFVTAKSPTQMALSIRPCGLCRCYMFTRGVPKLWLRLFGRPYAASSVHRLQPGIQHCSTELAEDCRYFSLTVMLARLCIGSASLHAFLKGGDGTRLALPVPNSSWVNTFSTTAVVVCCDLWECAMHKAHNLQCCLSVVLV